MALPGSGALSIAQIETEFGLPAGSVWPNAFWGKGGAPASGSLVLPNDFWGRSAVIPYPNAPTMFSAGTVQNGVSTLSLTWPAGHATNDVAIIAIQSNNQTIATPTGCTALSVGSGVGTSAGVGGTRLSLFWIRATSAAMAAISIADSGNVTSAAMTVFRGCRVSGLPYETVTSQRATSATTAIAMSASTYLTGINRTLFAAIALNRDLASSSNVSGWANTSTSGMTELYDATFTASNGGGLAAAYGLISGQTTTGSITATQAVSAVFEAFGVALVPEGIPPNGQVSPEAGTYSTGADYFTLTSTAGSIPWNWTVVQSSAGFSASVANGGSATSITFSLAQGVGDRNCVVQVTRGNYTWNIELFSAGSGGGCMAMTMTL